MSVPYTFASAKQALPLSELDDNFTYLDNQSGANTPYTPAGTGAVATTVQTKLRTVSIDVTDFGTIGNSSTGDDAVFQAAINYLLNITNDSGVQGELNFTGTIYITSTKQVPKSIRLVGKGRNFNSVIKPLASFSGSSFISLDGDQCIGGYSFRNRFAGFTLDCSLVTSQKNAFYINKAYDIQFDDVWVYNLTGTGVYLAGTSSSTTNFINLNNFACYGVSAGSGTSAYGIRVTNYCHGVNITNPDIEIMFNGISVEGTDNTVTIVNPYCERNIVGWINTGGPTTSLIVQGGVVSSPGAAGIAANISGDNTTVIGGNYIANGGSGLYIDPSTRRNSKLIGVTGDISDTKNYAWKQVADTAKWYPSNVTNQKTPASGVATTFYNLICPYESSTPNLGICEVVVNARDQAGYSLWTGRYRFGFSNPDSTLRTTAVVEYGKTNVNISGNYALILTCALNPSGTTIAFQITATTTGALGAGISPLISTSAELVQWNSAGTAYIQAA